MNNTRRLNLCGLLDTYSPQDVSRGKRDLIILKYMAKRVQVTLRLTNQHPGASKPLLYFAKERRGRTHRVAIYNSQDLLQANNLSFVGFVSRLRKPTIAAIVDEIQAVDASLVIELADKPGMLSYSSLELHDGNWYNLVLLNDANAKMHIQKNSTHVYAAYQLSPYYYEWIRLHNGVMPEGLPNNEMTLQKTKYYTFEDSQQRPAIRELTYGA